MVKKAKFHAVEKLTDMNLNPSKVGAAKVGAAKGGATKASVTLEVGGKAGKKTNKKKGKGGGDDDRGTVDKIISKKKVVVSEKAGGVDANPVAAGVDMFGLISNPLKTNKVRRGDSTRLGKEKAAYMSSGSDSSGSSLGDISSMSSGSSSMSSVSSRSSRSSRPSSSGDVGSDSDASSDDASGSGLSEFSGPSDASSSSSAARRVKAAHRKKKEDAMREKVELITRITNLNKLGFSATRKFSIRDDLDEIRYEFYRLQRENNVKKSMKTMQKILISITTAVEMLNNHFDPFNFKLDGLSKSIMLSIDDFTDVFEQLYDKYSGKSKVAPELQLVFALCSAAVFHHAGNCIKSAATADAKQTARREPAAPAPTAYAQEFSRRPPAHPPTPHFMNSVTPTMEPGAGAASDPIPNPNTPTPPVRRTMKGPGGGGGSFVPASVMNLASSGRGGGGMLGDIASAFTSVKNNL
jgi:hypothetical protein